jgi:ribose/xylose/arabinose/galactoside ABC-type transport system permease subunit
MSGAFCGVVIINVLTYALLSMNVPQWLLTLVNGMLLVIALTIDGLRNKKSGGGGVPMGAPGMTR